MTEYHMTKFYHKSEFIHPVYPDIHRRLSRCMQPGGLSPVVRLRGAAINTLKGHVILTTYKLYFCCVIMIFGRMFFFGLLLFYLLGPSVFYLFGSPDLVSWTSSHWTPQLYNTSTTDYLYESLVQPVFVNQLATLFEGTLVFTCIDVQ